MTRTASRHTVSARSGSRRPSRRVFAAAAAVCLAAALGLSACSAPSAAGIGDSAHSGDSAAAQLDTVRKGATAPDASFTAIYANGMTNGSGAAIASGDQVSVSDFQGKVVIMTFWATWCGYCVADMPIWEGFAQKYGDDLVVVAINRGDDRGGALKYAQGRGYDFVWGMESEETYAAYPSSGIPFTVVIDREGTVQFIANGSHRDMEAFMSEIIEPLVEEAPAV